MGLQGKWGSPAIKGLVVCAGLLVHSWPADARIPRQANELSFALWQLNLPAREIDWDSDGQSDLIREFDTKGRLSRLTVRGWFEGRPAVTSIIPGPLGASQGEVRSIDQKLVHRWLYHPALSEIIREEVWYAPETNQEIRRRILKRTSDPRYLTSQESILRKGRWVNLAATRIASALQQTAAESRAYRERVEYRREELEELYPACFNSRPASSPTDCSRPAEQLRGLAEAFGIPMSPPLVECTEDRSLFLSTGFSIDLRSCRSSSRSSLSDPVSVLRNDTDLVINHVACLSNLNERFAENVVQNIALLRPRLYCANPANPNAFNAEELMCGSNGEAACIEGTRASAAYAGAFSLPTVPGHILLAGEDPTTPRPPSDFDATRYTRSEAIFHELLHTAGHFGCSDHNHGGMGDEVYGCQALCGGVSSSRYLTREGCQACLRADHNRPSRSNLRACDRLPSAGARRVDYAETTLRMLQRCEAQQTATACQDLIRDRAEADTTCSQGTATFNLLTCIRGSRRAALQELNEALSSITNEELEALINDRANGLFTDLDANGNLRVRNRFSGESAVRRRQQYLSFLSASVVSTLCRGLADAPSMVNPRTLSALAANTILRDSLSDLTVPTSLTPFFSGASLRTESTSCDAWATRNASALNARAVD